MKLFCWTDGGSKGNPGPSGIGVVIKDDYGTYVKKIYDHIKRATCNEAEYLALVRCLDELKKIRKANKIERVTIFTDSLLMYSQLCYNGTGKISKDKYTIFKVKKSHLKILNEEIKLKINGFDFPIILRHIERKYNQESDSLATIGIDYKSI